MLGCDEDASGAGAKDNSDWHQHAKRLQQYAAEYQRLPRPSAGENFPKEAKLGAWAKEQSVQMRRGRLSADQIERLEQIHTMLAPAPSPTPEEEKRREERMKKRRWAECFERLKAYARGNGRDANIPRDGETGDPKLWAWARDQRTAFRKGTLGRKREARLRAIGLDLCGQRTYRRRYNHARFGVLWERNFAHLVEYQQEHGHCRVPFSYATEHHGKLGHWVTDQRRKGAGTYKGAKGEKVELRKSKVAKVSLVRARSEFNNVNMN